MLVRFKTQCPNPRQVIFVGEEAVDAGGVRKEFFLLIMKELLDPKYGMFRYYEESRLIWFSNKVQEVLLALRWLCDKRDMN